ncbi:hypothetical protein [Fusobacterium nucleatum]
MIVRFPPAIICVGLSEYRVCLYSLFTDISEYLVVQEPFFLLLE